MKFINHGSTRRIRIGSLTKCVWETVKHNEVIELEKSLGLKLGFKIVTTEGQIGDKKVETKQIETDDLTDDVKFLNKLIKIKGVGHKTAEDILMIFQTEENLKGAISRGESLAIRDDIEIKLRGHYGK